MSIFLLSLGDEEVAECCEGLFDLESGDLSSSSGLAVNQLYNFEQVSIF